MGVKQRTAAFRKSMGQMEGGEGRLTLFRERMASFIGTLALSAVVAAHMGDSDHPKGKILFIWQLPCF